MSKLSLKKELSVLTKEQLMEVVLSAYSASKEAKEYFDFFVDPRPSELLEKYETLVAKEFSRVKIGRRSKARISHVRKYLKKFISFEPGTDYVIALYVFTINYALLTEKTVYFTPILFNGIKKVVEEALKYADEEGEFLVTFEKISELATDKIGTRYFAGVVRDSLNHYVNDPRNNTGKLK